MVILIEGEGEGGREHFHSYNLALLLLYSSEKKTLILPIFGAMNKKP
jgi:hypothetical protein